MFFPSLSTKMQELVNKGINLNIDNFNNMPNLIKEILGNYNDNNYEDQETEKEESKKIIEDDDINIRSRKGNEIIQIDGNNTDKEILKMKNNKISKELINQKEGDSANTNEDKNNNTESKVKSTNKSDVMIMKSENQKGQIIEEDNNSKEAFLK